MLGSARGYASASVGKELRFLAGAVGRGIGYISAAFEGVAKELTFILYGSARAVGAAFMTHAQAPVYATVGFVLAAILLLLFLGSIVLALLVAATRRRW